MRGIVICVGLAACAHNVPQDRATGPDGRITGLYATGLPISTTWISFTAFCTTESSAFPLHLTASNLRLNIPQDGLKGL